MRTYLLQTAALFVLGAVFFGGASSVAIAAATSDPKAEDTIALQADNEILLSQSDMNASRGAAAITSTLTSSQSLAATTSGNALNVGGDLTNGNITVGDNLNGFGSYVMNTGNNSTINAATNFNVQITTTP